MRDKYWAMYIELIDSKYYYWHYRARSTFWDNVINAVSLLTTAYGITSWALWKQFYVAWAVLVGTAQVLSTMRPILPFSRRIIDTNFLFPDLDELVNEVDHDWDKIDSLSDLEISDLIYAYNQKYIKLENKYAKGADFPRNKCCQEKAVRDRANYFKQHYDVDTILK